MKLSGSLLLFTAFLLQIHSSYAQEPVCGSDEVQQFFLKNDRLFRTAREQRESGWLQNQQEKSNNYKESRTQGDQVYEIPVVVHVIHTGQPTGSIYNMPDETIVSVLNELNQRLACIWPGVAGVNEGGVSVPFRFKLAKRSPECGTTTGINRVNGSAIPGYSQFGVSLTGTSNPGADVSSVKSLSNWSDSFYLNIWIVTQIQGAGAFASFAGTPKGGITIAATQFNGTLLIHEIGHYLGLFHTFEGSTGSSSCPPNNDCTVDGDRVCDTDPHLNINGCPEGNNNCTGRPFSTIVFNYMSYFSCANRFTAGQARRILYQMQNFASSLLTSLGGVEPGYIPFTLPVPVPGCIPAGTTQSGNTANIGPVSIKLADLEIQNSGYSFDGFRSYIDHTIPAIESNCLNGRPQPVARLNSGQNYNITVKTEFIRQNVRGWIDYNNNGIFEPSELIISNNGLLQGNEIHTAGFTVPTSGIVKCTSLRGRIAADAFGYAAPSPCAGFEFGQAEDFIVIIQEETITPITLSISSNKGSSICKGTSVTFGASAINAGDHLYYQWKINDENTGSNSNTFSSNSIRDGDRISCVLSSTTSCLSVATAISNTIIMEVSENLTPAIAISASENNICPNTPVLFDATITNGGSNPAYQWKLNTSNTGSNRSDYQNNTLSDGDRVTCILTSSIACLTTNTATSNSLIISVKPSEMPAVFISGNTIVQAGTVVTLTATATASGNNPAYQWQDSIAIDGWQNISGAENSTLSYYPVSDGIKIRNIIRSNAPCPTASYAISNVLQLKLITDISERPVRYYPNPTGSILVIDSLAPASMWQLADITDLYGRAVTNALYIANKTIVVISVSQLRPGMYLVRLRKKTGEPLYLRFIKI